MIVQTKPLYVPALRMKAGELQGIRDLAPNVADYVLPRMIVPPRAERDQAFQSKLLDDQGVVPDIGSSLAGHWPNRDVLVEATHLMQEFGRDRLGLWLPKMFDRAREARVQAIPLITLANALHDDVGAYKSAIDQRANIKLAVAISSSDLGSYDKLERCLRVFDSLGLAPSECLVIADFHDADLSTPEVVAPIIRAALEDLQTLAPWQQIIFQGTNYPENNPAEEGANCLVPRNEWLAWCQAVKFDPNTADHMVFGDYAADCAKISFGPGGGAAIRHYRYTTPNAWLVQRGAKSGTHESVMRQVCGEILGSGLFAGRNFSSADNYIYLTARGLAGPGNAKDWRAVNTTHHITRVVADTGAVRQVPIQEQTFPPLIEQVELFR